MKILFIHNAYQQSGGEDVVAATEARLLAERGHSVVWYRRDNDELLRPSAPRGLQLGLKTIWASDSYRALMQILRDETPDVAHFHNTFPLISPAAYYACAKARVPVVQTLHNYRFLCPAAKLYRNGHICESCVGREIPWTSVVDSCYRNSVLATAAVAAMLTAHRFLNSWERKIDAYIALSEFARQKFIQGGLPARRICVKPNCVHPDPGIKAGPGDYALFVGRLSPEKGIRVLLDAWKQLPDSVTLLIAGEGPMSEQVKGHAEALGPRIKFIGAVAHERIRDLIHSARFLVFPSTWYEVFPLTIIEAFACGVPVIASRLGSMADTIAHGKTGLHFSAGNPDELAERCLWAWNHPNEMQQMGLAARAEYEAKYTAEKNYKMLTNIYQSVRDKIAASGEPHILRSDFPHVQGAR
jgi:glycosyltransferase involved in cell wall biosynthesis